MNKICKPVKKMCAFVNLHANKHNKVHRYINLFTSPNAWILCKKSQILHFTLALTPHRKPRYVWCKTNLWPVKQDLYLWNDSTHERIIFSQSACFVRLGAKIENSAHPRLWRAHRRPRARRWRARPALQQSPGGLSRAHPPSLHLLIRTRTRVGLLQRRGKFPDIIML